MKGKIIKVLSVAVLFFYAWTFMGVCDWVYAAEQKLRGQESGVGSRESKNQGKSPAERLEQVLSQLEQDLGGPAPAAPAAEAQAAADWKGQKAKAKTKLKEINNLDKEIRKEFARTEKHLKDKNLPPEVLARHHKFVQHYEDNLKELKSNLSALDRAKDVKEADEAAGKLKAHLARVKPPSKHVPLDPNKLPHRAAEPVYRTPRTKPEEFKKENKPTAALSIIEESSELRVESLELKTKTSEELRVASLESKTVTDAGMPLLSTPNSQLSTEFFRATSDELRAPVLLAAVVPPNAEDLAETIEVQFTPEIRAKAQELGNKPVAIYEWVRNNVEFVPTYGSIQGAHMTLLTKQGNAFDTASLLIALLRVSNIPARYVYGTIELPIEKVMNWAGGFTDAKAALDLIASGGIPVAGYASGGKIVTVRMEHVWVEGYVPYGNYRGMMRDDSVKTWIPMDGSYKQYTYNEGLDLTSTIPFDQDAYLSQVQERNPIHYYQDLIQNYLDTNMLDKTIFDVKRYAEVKLEWWGILPSTLPYKIITTLNKYSNLTSGFRSMVEFSIYDYYGISEASYTVSIPELAAKKMTLSYIPATSSDESLINANDGFIYDIPAYLLNLKPILMLEGIVILAGSPITMGAEQSLSIKFYPINGISEIVKKKLIAGNYYAIGVDLQGVNENVLGQRYSIFSANVNTQNPESLGYDDLIGERLYILAMTYFLTNDGIYRSGAGIYNIAQMRILSEGITSYSLSISSLFSVPVRVSPSGLEIDVDMDRVVAISKEGNKSKEKDYMNVMGLAISYHEHFIFEKIEDFSSISAVKALQIANVTGIPVYKINKANLEQILPLLQISLEIKNDIQNAVNAQKEVIVQQNNVQLNDWIGVGYIITDPITGFGAYRISGGLAGGTSTKSEDGQYVDVYKESCSVTAAVPATIAPAVTAQKNCNRLVQLSKQIANRIDLYIRRTMVTQAIILEGEIINGDKVVENANCYKDKNCRGSINCSDLVFKCYKAVGINLWDLVRRYNIPGTNGVLYFYNLANYLKIMDSIRSSNNPIEGDMVFFNYTTCPSCLLSHMGIVTVLPDRLGRIEFIHHSSKGVVRAFMNRLKKDEFNKGLTNSCLASWVPEGTECQGGLAGQLFAGYGTVRDLGILFKP